MKSLLLFWIFAKISFFTFGGGTAMIPLFNEELVNTRQFMTQEEFVNLIALAQVTPGPIGLNAATYIGMEQDGVLGAFCATLGVAMPSLTIGLLAAIFFRKSQKNKTVEGMLTGVRPASLGLILASVVFFADVSVFTVPLHNLWQGKNFSICWTGLIIFLLTLAYNKLFPKASLSWILLSSAGLGILLQLAMRNI